MITTKPPNYLFVYGTLMSSYEDNPFNLEMKKYCSFISKGYANGKLFLINYFPGFINSNCSSKVFGEIYKIENKKKLFKLLDEYEDYFSEDELNSMYIRKKVKIFIMSTQNQVDAWTYIFNKSVSGFKQIESGDFLKS